MKNHLAFKFLAILLCAASLFTVLACTVGIFSFLRIGLYSNTLKDLQDKQMSDDLGALAERIAAYYTTTAKTDCTTQFLDAYFEEYDQEHAIREPQSGMWYYVLIDYNSKETVDIGPGSLETTAGAILYKEYQARPKYPVILDILDTTDTPPILSDTEAPDEEPENEDPAYPQGWFQYDWYDPTTYKNESYILQEADGPIYKVQLYLLPGAYEQEVAFLWELLALAHEHRFGLFLPLVLSLLLLTVCITYLSTAAGKKPGRELAKPGALNKIPLDLYLTAAVLAVIFLTQFYIRLVREEFARDTIQIIALGILITGYLGCLLITGFFFACVAQMKQPAGYWWRHSAIYNLYKLLRRAVRSLIRLLRVSWSSLKKTWKRFWELLPLTWQWILWAIIMCGAIVLAVLSQKPWLIIASLVFVSISFFYALHAFKILLDGAKRMSQGDLDTQVDTSQLMGGFTEFATHLNALADVAVVAAQKQMRSERMRAELITNVTHDIKTPLTSIINYVDFLKTSESKEDSQQYLEVLSRQSLRMKKLIDDLLELSKATTGNMPVDMQDGDAVEYLNQALGEFSDKLDAASLVPIFESPSEPVMIRCDGRLTWRVLSNLLSNAVKYALPGTRLYVDLTRLDDRVLISLKNISRQQLNVNPDELMERFVRGDVSRNTEGSGLGLNIAKSLMELQKGQMQLLVDGDLFKVTLSFTAASQDTAE